MENPAAAVNVDPLLRTTGIENHSHGNCSYAAVGKGDCEVRTDGHATFVGIYNGHGGDDAERYVARNMFKNFSLTRFEGDPAIISEELLRKTFEQTENGYLGRVAMLKSSLPDIAMSGCQSLVGVLVKNQLYVANLGDSTIVLGTRRGGDMVVAEPLNTGFNTGFTLDVGDDFRKVVQMYGGPWKVRGTLETVRTIGDAYLKVNDGYELPSTDIFPRFHPFTKPYCTATPKTLCKTLHREDFLILASNGFWEYLDAKSAVEIVARSDRLGIGQRLVEIALERAATVRSTTYAAIKTLNAPRRRTYHDSMSVLVVYIDQLPAAQETGTPAEAYWPAVIGN